MPKGDYRQQIKMAEEGGQTSMEYSIVQTNFSRMVTCLQQEGILHEVAMKVFEKKLITPQRLKVYNDSSKASDFVIEMLGRIETNKGDFHLFLSCLSAIPTLNKLTSDLKAQLGSGTLSPLRGQKIQTI